MSTQVTFKWPWQYEFPPFFTLQPNPSTRERQLDAWTSLVLDYCQANRIYTTSVQELHNSALFSNERIGRSLSVEGVKSVLELLERRKHIEWLDRQQSRCHVYWRRPEEWGKLIYDWAVSFGLLNTVCTLLEITQGDDTENEPFYELDRDVLIKALRHLESEHKVELIGNAPEVDGVKFFK